MVLGVIGSRWCAIQEGETSGTETACEQVLTSRVVRYATGRWREGLGGPSCQQEGENGHKGTSVRGQWELAMYRRAGVVT
jgi:hypothetical protein